MNNYTNAAERQEVNIDPGYTTQNLTIDNQVDFRTLKPTSNLARSSAARQRRKELTALGVCYICGQTPVQNRKICRPCVERNQRASERSVFKKYGVELPWELR